MNISQFIKISPKNKYTHFIWYYPLMIHKTYKRILKICLKMIVYRYIQNHGFNNIKTPFSLSFL